MRALLPIVAIALALCGLPASALEFRSVGDAPAPLYDGPSLKTKRTHVVSRATPVEVISSMEGWVKVREPGGQLGWVEAGALVAQRHVVVTGAATVRAEPVDTGAAVFEAKPGLILEFVDSDGLWARVRHRDGLAGYVRAQQVWGL